MSHRAAVFVDGNGKYTTTALFGSSCSISLTWLFRYKIPESTAEANSKW